MFTIVNYRRRVALLVSLALLTSALVAAPIAATEDPPEPSYAATFDACVDVPGSGFSDVPSGHANVGDIDCIAYYGVTKGTSATTYSPLSAVTREQMALFLMRLADLVGIDVPPAGDTGFSDIGDLSPGSQAAISQLAQLEITRGTSDTTYSPADSVTRGHMALFIQRLMDKMDPMTDGDDSDGDHGYTPSDVADNDQDEDVGSSFTDLDSVTKSTYDAVTQLYELGVAIGISETAYGPSALMTRASMAGFMAAVLDHSNVRPAGLTIQASQTSGFGEINGVAVVVSVRDDSFLPVADQPVDIFSSEADNSGLQRDGTCDPTNDVVIGDCTWNENDEFTDSAGNIVDDGAGAMEGVTAVYYAWIGDKEGATFDADDVDEVSASIASMNDQGSMNVTSTVNENAASADTAADDDTDNDEPQVDLDAVKSVTFTVQLVDGADGAGGDVARSDVEIIVGVMRSSAVYDDDNDTTAEYDTVYNNSNQATLKTDEDGMASFTVESPSDNEDNDRQERVDIITFASDGLSDEIQKVRWIETDSVTTTAKSSAPGYVVREADGDASVSASVTLYDQYGNTHRESRGQMVVITINNQTPSAGDTANVNGNGVARRGATVEDRDAGEPVTVSYNPDPTEDPDVDITVPALDDDTVQVVTRADEDDTGSRNVHTLYADDNEFTTEETSGGTDADKVYGYDADDTFTDGGAVITMDKFEELLANPATGVNAAVVDVVIYDPDGSSIFQVTTSSAG